MTYQLLRVEAEIYKAGDTISGVQNVAWHNGSANGTSIWVSSTGNMDDVSVISRDKIAFSGNAIFLRTTAIGLEYDGVNDGELDFLASIKPAQQLYSDLVPKLAEVAAKNSRDEAGMRVVVFVAVVDLTKEKCEYKGIIPLDTMLDCCIVT